MNCSGGDRGVCTPTMIPSLSVYFLSIHSFDMDTLALILTSCEPLF